MPEELKPYNRRYNKMSMENLSNAAEQKERIDISNHDKLKANKINIIKRDGRKEQFNPEKLWKVCLWGTNNDDLFAKELLRDTEIKLHQEIHVKDMFSELINTAVNKISLLYPQWEEYAARLLLIRIYKETYNISTNEDYTKFSSVLAKGLDYKIYDKNTACKLSEEELKQIDNLIAPERDFLFTFKGLSIFFDKYCLNYTKTKKLELPQHVYMRIAVALNIEEEDRIRRIADTYNALSKHEYTAATPIVLNSFTPGQQLSSCVLNTLSDDSHSILDTGKNLGIYSKFKGGTALDISSMRAAGSYIAGTQGYSSGPVPFMRYYESIMKAWNQGGKRVGACCVYFSWWHMNAFDILSLKSNGGTDENRARGLQYGIKLNELFIERALNNENISLFDPYDTPGLLGVFGKEFEEKYIEYENKQSIKKKSIPARDLLEKIFKERTETGNIYLFHEENVNESTLLNRYIGSSNLCLAGDTKVLTLYGIKELQDVKPGDFVKSKNILTGEVQYKEVTDSAMMSARAHVIRITDDLGNNITCTPDHQVYTVNRGYVKAQDLNENDVLDTNEL